MINNQNNKELNSYEDIISSLTAEVESLRHQLAVKTHNQLLLKLQDKSKHQQVHSKSEKKLKEIQLHFQDELTLTKELIDIQSVIDTLNSKINDKQFAMYITERSNMFSQVKELSTQVLQLKEQLNAQSRMLNEKKRMFNELIKRRENIENYVNTNKRSNLSSLFCVYNKYVYEIQNLNNEYTRKRSMILLNQQNMKIQKLIEQLSIRDEYITNYNKQLLQMKTELKYEEDNNIKPIKDLLTEYMIKPHNVLSLHMFPQIKTFKPLTKADHTFSKHITHQTPSLSPSSLPLIRNNSTPQLNTSNVNSNNITRSTHFMHDNTLSVNSVRHKYDYSKYSNPNIFKLKKVFKTKTNEIIQKAKNNELSELKLSILNDKYSGSKLKYVNNKHNKNNEEHNDYVITFEAKLLNKSLHNGTMYSNFSDKETCTNINETNTIHYHNNNKEPLSGRNYNHYIYNSKSLNIKEREIDLKIKKLLGRKYKYSPYIK